MKKALLLVLLVPFFALSQGTLAKWNVSDWPYQLTPSNIAGGLSATALTGTGISFPSTGDSNGVSTSGWGTDYSNSKYVEFTISSTTGFSVSAVNFEYRGDTKKHRVQYSTDNFATILTAYTTDVTNAGAGEWANFNNAQTFTTPLAVGAGKTLKVRIYAAQGNARFIKNITVNGGVTTTPLSGTYVIGASSQTTYPQFPTLTSAIAYLNAYGVSGAVTFLLKDATYTNATETFPLTINSFAGSSATKTVTFKPYPGVNPSINASTTLLPAVFKINGADNIIFDGSNDANGASRNLTIYNQDPQPDGGDANRAVVWIASNGTDPATNITVKFTKIDMLKKNADYNFCAGIFVGNNTTVTEDSTAGAANNNINIISNDFWNVKQAVFINGGTTQTTNVSVIGNDMGESINAESILQGIKIKNVNTFVVSSNYIHNIYRNSAGGSLKSSAIYVAENSSNGTIDRNNIADVTKTINEGNLFAGILLSSTATASNILVKNNFVRDVRGYNAGNTYMAGGYGIWVNTGGGYKIYNNTVLQNKAQDGTGNGYSAALFVETAINLDVKNNIFANTQLASNPTQSFGVLIKLADTSGFTALDYNDIFGEYIGYLGTNPDANPVAAYQTGMSGWKSTTGKEAHMVDVNPVFVSATDLHISENNTVNSAINNAALTLSVVTKDFDGQVRNTTTPDIGADEFGGIGFPTAGNTAGIYCDGATTWNGTSWNNGTPSATKDAIFAGNFTQSGSTFYACSVFVLNGATVSFSGNSDVIVSHSVNVQTTGSLTIESGSNLIQLEDDVNTGIVTIKRDSGKLKRLDYTLWCAPVLDSRATGYQTLRLFSMGTSNGRFYDYHTDTNNYWPLDEITAKFQLGRGVLIRMPNSDAATPDYSTGAARLIFHGSFTGTPNTGTIRKTLEYYSDTQAYNVVGNPYPSPLCVTDFINGNLNSITGTLWLWRKTNDQTQTTYSTVNLGGYVANSAPGGTTTDGNDLIADPYSITTKGSLNTAQGFFVQAKGANKDLVYTNSMRIKTHTASFFKSAAAAQTEVAEETPQFDRVWLNAVNNDGLFAQALIGYNETTTTGLDNGFDSEMITRSTLNLYTVMHTETDTVTLAIQTRGHFVVTDQVALGFAASAAGTYTISIDHTDGTFANGQKVYIKDNAEGITRELTANNFSFETEAGEFNDRFTILYTTATDTELGTAPVTEITKEVMVYNAESQVKVVAPENIKSVVVYDLTGKVIYQNAAVNNVEFASSTLNATHQVVIVTVTLDNQKVVTKKLMMM